MEHQITSTCPAPGDPGDPGSPGNLPLSHFAVSQRLLQILVWIVGLPTIVATLAGLAGGWWWVLDLFSHFHWYYMWALTFIVVASVLTRPRRTAAIWVVPLAINLYLIAPLYLSTSPVDEDRWQTASDVRLKLLHMNVLVSNRNHRAVLDVIHQSRADVVFLQEVNARWLAALQTGTRRTKSDVEDLSTFETGTSAGETQNFMIFENQASQDSENSGGGNLGGSENSEDFKFGDSRYSGSSGNLGGSGGSGDEVIRGYRLTLAQTREDAFGVAVLVADPLEENLKVIQTRTMDLTEGQAGVPAVEMALEWQGRRLNLLSLHTLPPVRPWYAYVRDLQLKAAGRWVASQTGAAVVIGDLNATPWSAGYQALVAQTGLVDSQAGFGYQPTFPGNGFLTFFRDTHRPLPTYPRPNNARPACRGDWPERRSAGRKIDEPIDLRQLHGSRL